MHTEVLPVDPASIARAAVVLRGGGLVAFPTETVYGLGANALDAAAVGRIFTAKGRPANNPVIVHVAASSQVRQVVADWPKVADVLANRFWPGPLTLVLPKRAEVPDMVTAGGPTVAVRVPAHATALALLRAIALPLAAPSANRSNQLSPTCAAHVLRDLDGHIDLILDDGPTPGGIESTVIDLTTTTPRLLRLGLLPAGDIERVIGSVQRPPINVGEGALLSPGMMPRHYAPRTPLSCVEDDGYQALHALRGMRLRIGLLRFADADVPPPPDLVTRTLPNDPAGAAAQLYAALHELDDRNVDRIIAVLPPDTEAWLAIRDRLRRASS